MRVLGISDNRPCPQIYLHSSVKGDLQDVQAGDRWGTPIRLQPLLGARDSRVTDALQTRSGRGTQTGPQTVVFWSLNNKIHYMYVGIQDFAQTL